MGGGEVAWVYREEGGTLNDVERLWLMMHVIIAFAILHKCTLWEWILLYFFLSDVWHVWHFELLKAVFELFYVTYLTAILLGHTTEEFGPHPDYCASRFPPTTLGLWCPSPHHAVTHLCHHTGAAFQSYSVVSNVQCLSAELFNTDMPFPKVPLKLL